MESLIKLRENQQKNEPKQAAGRQQSSVWNQNLIENL